MLYDTKGGDLPSLDDVYDVCVAGAGPAGISMSLSLARQGKRVLLLEGGGREFSAESQALYQGDIVGKEYYPLETSRLRHFGGTTGHWSGWSRPLDPRDFAKVEHIADSGWPIGYDELRPYEETVCDILGIESFRSSKSVKGSNEYFEDVQFGFSKVRFGERYFRDVSEHANIDLVLNANVVDARIEAGSDRIEAFVYRGYEADATLRRARAPLCDCDGGDRKPALSAERQQSTAERPR